MSSLSSQKNEETIKSLSSEITKLGGKPIKKSDDLKITIKELTKQLEEITVKSILSDKIIKDLDFFSCEICIHPLFFL